MIPKPVRFYTTDMLSCITYKPYLDTGTTFPVQKVQPMHAQIHISYWMFCCVKYRWVFLQVVPYCDEPVGQNTIKE